MAHKYLFLLYPLVLHGVFLQNSWNSVRYSHDVFRNPRIRIAIPRSCGILEGISDQSRENCLELPSNWYENNDLLGFAIVFAYVESEFVGCNCYSTIKGNGKQEHLGSFSLLSKPFLDSDMSDLPGIMCYPKVAIKGKYIKTHYTKPLGYFSSLSKPFLDSDKSDLVCIMCYPKAAIEGNYHSNQWTHLVASFDSEVRVEFYGIHLIYAEDNVQMHPSMVQAISSRGNSFINIRRKFFSHENSRDHGSPTEDDYSKAHN